MGGCRGGCSIALSDWLATLAEIESECMGTVGVVYTPWSHPWDYGEI